MLRNLLTLIIGPIVGSAVAVGAVIFMGPVNVAVPVLTGTLVGSVVLLIVMTLLGREAVRGTMVLEEDLIRNVIEPQSPPGMPVYYDRELAEKMLSEYEEHNDLKKIRDEYKDVGGSARVVQVLSWRAKEREEEGDGTA